MVLKPNNRIDITIEYNGNAVFEIGSINFRHVSNLLETSIDFVAVCLKATNSIIHYSTSLCKAQGGTPITHQADTTSSDVSGKAFVTLLSTIFRKGGGGRRAAET